MENPRNASVKNSFYFSLLSTWFVFVVMNLLLCLAGLAMSRTQAQVGSLTMSHEQRGTVVAIKIPTVEQIQSGQFSVL